MFDNEEYTRTFTSFSGADIAVSFNQRIIGELQGIQYNVTREVAPIYTMGSPDVRSFSRGKRGIEGSLVFAQFDRDALMEEMRKEYDGRVPQLQKIQQFRANNSGLQDQILQGLQSTSASGANTYGISTWNEQMTQFGYGTAPDNQDPGNMIDYFEPEYADQLMPFNITITMANEYGARAGMEVYGVQLLSEASGFSIDDVMTAKAYSFVARKIKPVSRKDQDSSSGVAGALSSIGEFIGGFRP